MKKLLISILLLLAAACAIAAEKKPIKDVNIDAFTKETQATAKGSGDNHVAITWWIPNEFWESIFARDQTTSEIDKKTMLDAVAGVSLLAVAQADVSPVGAFKFYTKASIQNQMMISYTGAMGEKRSLSPMQVIDPDLEVVLGIFKPILGAAMGNLGSNLHFYVLDDKIKSSRRLIDPYREGRINIKLAKKTGDRMTAEIEMPLNCLYVPRKCPNGKDAHITWNYCPWTGRPIVD